MYNISFKPSLGEAVEIVSSPLSADNQPTTILFTAQLSQSNYEKLVRDNGHVQLWSDIPHGRANNGAWGKMDFEDARPTYPSSLKRVTLEANAQPEKDVMLSITVPLPPPTDSGKRRFSFTYRITYPAGGITWLGQFGKNGTVTLSKPQPNTSQALTLLYGWSVDKTQPSRVFEVKEVNGMVEVAILGKRSDFEAYALGENALLSDLTNARALFLVPTPLKHTHKVLPTYAIFTSPGLSTSISNDGVVTLSGAGTAYFQSSDSFRELRPFVEQVLLHSQLTNWKILASGAKSKCVALASTASSTYMDVLVIPLRTSRQGVSPTFRLGYARLVEIFGRMDAFRLKSAENAVMHLFSRQSDEVDANEQDIVLELCAHGGHFSLEPYAFTPKLDELKLENVEEAVAEENVPSPAPDVHSSIPILPEQTEPATASINTYSAPEQDTLSSIVPPNKEAPPTPPLTPKLAPLEHTTSSASIATLVASVSSLPGADDISSDKAGVAPMASADPNRLIDADENPDHSYALEKIPYTPRHNAVSIFQAVFASIRTFLRVFFRIFLCPIIPFTSGRIRRLPPAPASVDEAHTSRATEKNALSTEVSLDYDEGDNLAQPPFEEGVTHAVSVEK
ncbi:hypothetical protein D9613_001651 [Agrocybe pediades]|uniref:Uncharacterized protein n=1 Tax=Agrocybe pediades TaxID=84607 RepID=A0A8H4R422_9AGAR|nr:hypothetical protein D9613_001651 [Agrocybe pediades]